MFSSKLKHKLFSQKIVILLIILSFLISDSKAYAFNSKKCSNDPATTDLQYTKNNSSEITETKVIYLTFDDGPSLVITNKLLDILKECNVKATFFVVGKEIVGRESILLRIYNEGHSIGLHTYTHNFKTIYKNDDIFIAEMKKTAVLVHDIVGVTPTAIRFPGGSDCVLNMNFLEKLHKNNYKVFDWTVNLGDGINASYSPEKLLENAKKAKGNKNIRILLAHCNYNNINTCRALKSIISYYKSEGFIFKTIDENTEEFYYKFRNRKKH